MAGCEHTFVAMHSEETVAAVIALAEEGRSAMDIARKLGLPRSTVRDWLAGRLPGNGRCRMYVMDAGALPDAYAYSSRSTDPGASTTGLSCSSPGRSGSSIEFPGLLLRGLIHSDGCRSINTGRGGWRHPRYSFKNVSADILGIFCAACDRLGLRWTTAPYTVYVSRKADVERLDGFVGPKC
jgi:hypothetical protein